MNERLWFHKRNHFREWWGLKYVDKDIDPNGNQRQMLDEYTCIQLDVEHNLLSSIIRYIQVTFTCIYISVISIFLVNMDVWDEWVQHLVPIVWNGSYLEKISSENQIDSMYKIKHSIIALYKFSDRRRKYSSKGTSPIWNVNDLQSLSFF